MSEGPQGVQGEQGEQGPPGPLQRKVVVSFWLVVLIAFVVASVQGYEIRENRKLIDRMREHDAQAMEAHDALCTFKADLLRRIQDGREFVAGVEAGRRPPIEGISVNDLQRSIDGQQSTYDSLAPLDCEE